MKTKLKKTFINVAGILALYVLSFGYGSSVTAEPLVDQSMFHFKYSDVIGRAADLNDIHPALIAAIIQAESNFHPKAISPRGAKGLMQINPPTQKYLRLKNVFDPAQNIAAGSRYLKELLTKFEGDLKKAIAAYNAGPGAVERYAGIPPYKETREYVKKVMSYYELFRETLFVPPTSS